ncbi:MAG: hypothetical protein ACRDF4_00435 [Rhabdochlamydiaceae bacterium]
MYTQIITPTDRQALIDIPEDLLGRQLKVTVDPVKEEPKPIFNTIEEVHAAFNAVRIDTRGWKFNRDEANER